MTYKATGYPLVIATLFLIACGKTQVDYAVKGEFIYYNRLNSPVEVHIKGGLKKAQEDHTVAPGSSITFYTDDIGPKVADPKGYLPGISPDTTILQFNDSLCYAEYNHRGSKLNDINNYTYKKRGDADYLLF